MHRVTTLLRPLLTVTTLLASASLIQPTNRGPASWPQFGGPTRDFHAPSSVRLASAWPADGPERIWERLLGEGYWASWRTAIGCTRCSVATRRRWLRRSMPRPAARSGSTRGRPRRCRIQDLTQGPGPHATPLLTGAVVCVAGATGILHCLDRDTGAVRWRRDLVTSMGGTPVFRGYSSSPLAWRDMVVVAVGGDGHAVMAFRREDGREVWRAGQEGNTNSSPVLLDLGGVPQVVTFMERGFAAFDADTGVPRWSHPHPQRFEDNISLPLTRGRRVFGTSAMDGGARMIEVAVAGGRYEARGVWHQPRMGVYFTNVVWIDDHLYGSSGGLGPTFLTAIDAATGAITWQTRELTRASLIAADGKVVARTEDGELVLLRLSADSATVLARAPLLEAGPPVPPTLIDGVLYARDRTRIVAVALGAP